MVLCALALVPLLASVAPVNAATTTSVPRTPLGYYYVGKWKVSDVCYGISGTCTAFQGLIYASIIPSGGTSAIASALCWGSDVVCWAAETTARFFGINLYIYVYSRCFWNPFGPSAIIIPAKV